MGRYVFLKLGSSARGLGVRDFFILAVQRTKDSDVVPGICWSHSPWGGGGGVTAIIRFLLSEVFTEQLFTWGHLRHPICGSDAHNEDSLYSFRVCVCVCVCVLAELIGYQ